MADIKTRDTSEKVIKTLDHGKIVGERMRGAYVRTKVMVEDDRRNNQNSDNEYSTEQYESAVGSVTNEGTHLLEKQVQKALRNNKDRIKKENGRINEEQIQNNPDHKPQRKVKKESVSSAKKSAQKSHSKAYHKAGKNSNQTITKSNNTVAYHSKGAKATFKTTQKSIKTAEKAGKTAIKTAEKTARATKTATKTTVRAGKAAVQTTRVMIKSLYAVTKAAIKATVSAIKAIVAALKSLIVALGTAGVIALVIIIVISLVALLVASSFGIFFSNEDTGSEYSMQSVIAEINEEYLAQIEILKGRYTYDVLEISGEAVWLEVLSVYSVKTTTDPSNADEVATIDDGKKALIHEIFWLINTLTAVTETKTETIITQTTDEHGNLVETTTSEDKVYLTITVSHKTADEMADHYGFNEEMRVQLAEMLSEEKRGMWDGMLEGIE